MEKIIIKNRKGLKIVIVVDKEENQKGLVFLMHGFLGFKEQPILKEIGKRLKENNFTIISFDATNALGESDGKMEDGTISSYCDDLEDVINWSKSQTFYQESFLIVGHSLGGYCATNYAVNNNLKGIILLNPLVSGKLFNQTNDIREVLEECNKAKARICDSHSNQGIIEKASFNFIKDSEKHDLLKIADKIKCKVLMISGDIDEDIPIKDQNMLFDKIGGVKERRIIKDGDHDFEGKEIDVGNIVKEWANS